MFKKILIANRGEIAVRILRTCRDLGIETVVVYSTTDRDTLAVQLADEAICIGPAAAAQSYLNQQNIIQAGVATGAEAIHPGYGFLSENAEFADAVEAAGMTFIGPRGDTIRQMGDKATARALMQKAGVPVVPGSDGVLSDAAQGLALAKEIGFPVLIKASAGGGGKGMRVVRSEAEFEKAFKSAQNESQAAFSCGDLYMEKFVEEPKHIEVQILADRYGKVVHLGERDCSIQRNHQKMIEECPCRMLSDETRAEMGAVAVKAAAEANYVGAGTIEFIMDHTGRFYFIEMNTRLQVEHPITEEVYNVDLVKEQLRVAAGLKISLDQDALVPRGHAIECRINAEDPKRHFAPMPGHIRSLHLPGGPAVRIDSALLADSDIPPNYDAMIAKVITYGDTRVEAVRRMRRALSELIIDGIETNTTLQFMIMHHIDFVRGEYDTSFIEKHLEELVEIL